MPIVRGDTQPCADGSTDHDINVTYEDAEIIQGWCRNCGAEIDGDKVQG